MGPWSGGFTPGYSMCSPPGSTAARRRPSTLQSATGDLGTASSVISSLRVTASGASVLVPLGLPGRLAVLAEAHLAPHRVAFHGSCELIGQACAFSLMRTPDTDRIGGHRSVQVAAVEFTPVCANQLGAFLLQEERMSRRTSLELQLDPPLSCRAFPLSLRLFSTPSLLPFPPLRNCRNYLPLLRSSMPSKLNRRAVLAANWQNGQCPEGRPKSGPQIDLLYGHRDGQGMRKTAAGGSYGGRVAPRGRARAGRKRAAGLPPAGD